MLLQESNEVMISKSGSRKLACSEECLAKGSRVPYDPEGFIKKTRLLHVNSVSASEVLSQICPFQVWTGEVTLFLFSG